MLPFLYVLPLYTFLVYFFSERRGEREKERESKDK
jgi:hypothetical protein